MNASINNSDNTLEQSKKSKWREINWSEYDRSFVQRGDLTIWFDPEYIEKT